MGGCLIWIISVVKLMTGFEAFGLPVKDIGLGVSVAILLLLCFGFNVPPTAKVIWRRGHILKSHPTDWRSRESNP